MTKEKIFGTIELLYESLSMDKYGELLAVFAFGSMVNNSETATSDLDVQFIFDEEVSIRGAIVIGGLKVEYYFNSFHSIIELERQNIQDNRPLFSNIFNCICVHKNKDDTIEALIDLLNQTFNYNRLEDKPLSYLKNNAVIAYNRRQDLMTLLFETSNEFYYQYYLLLERTKNLYCDALRYDKLVEGKYQKILSGNTKCYNIACIFDKEFEKLYTNCFAVIDAPGAYQNITTLLDYVFERLPFYMNFNQYQIDFYNDNKLISTADAFEYNSIYK